MQNFVAKNMNRINKNAVHKDRRQITKQSPRKAKYKRITW